MHKAPMSRFEEIWNQCEPEISRFAKKQEKHKPKAWQSGRSADELGANQLISFAWTKLIESDPKWICTPDDMKKFFFKHIDGRVKNLTRPRSKTNKTKLEIVQRNGSYPSNDGDGDTRDPITEYQGSDSAEDHLTASELWKYVERTAPRLLPLLTFIIERVSDKERWGEISENCALGEKLDLTSQQVSVLKNQLKECIKGYHEEAMNVAHPAGVSQSIQTSRIQSLQRMPFGPGLCPACAKRIEARDPRLIPVLKLLMAGASKGNSLDRDLEVSAEEVSRLKDEIQECRRKSGYDAAHNVRLPPAF